jgi:ubiquinone biosynthesis UbiH/UbiF/VisC/COQ6 family hydroxylase
MVVWHGQYEARHRDSISFDAAEAGVRELGFIVENELLRAALWSQVEARPGIEILRGTPAQLIDEPDHLVVVLANGDRVRTRLLVGADGTASWVRQAVHVPLAQRSYEQMAIVAHVGSELPHGQTARQKFLQTGPVALLPLADGRSSVVWSCAEELAAELLGLPGEAFAARLTGQTDRVLGRLKLDSDRAAFPLRIAHAARYAGRRFALIGDAAHRVHPLAGLGVNLGFLDAAALAETLAETLTEHPGGRWVDPGDPRVLRRFERQRKGANLLALGSLDMLHRLFTSSSPVLGQIAAAGLGLVDRSGPLKRWLGAYAMGTQHTRRP